MTNSKIYLCNAFSLNMLPAGNNSITTEELIDAQVEAVLYLSNFVNALGHKEIAVIIGEKYLGKPLDAPRTSVSLMSGDSCIVAQYVGCRLPEGATSLPDGATIKWIIVRVG
jgi:hypothetical protein